MALGRDGLLSEKFLQLLYEAFWLRLYFVAELFGELLQEVALTPGQHGGNLHRHLDELIAPAAARATHDPLALDAEHGGGLGSARYLELAFAVERRYFELCPQRRLYERDRYRAHDVVSRPLEEGVGRDQDHELEMA